MKHSVLGLASGLVIIGAIIVGVGALTGNLWKTPTQLVPVSGQIAIRHRIRTTDLVVFDANITVTGTSGHILSYSGKLPVLHQKTASSARRVMDSEWTVEVRGDTVLMRLKKMPSQRRGLAISWQSPRLTITLPRDVAVKVTTTNGTVRLQGVDAASVVNTTNSAVIASAVDGPVQANTSSGSVFLDNVTGPVIVRNQNGGITLSNIRGSVDARTSTSPVTLTNLFGPVDVVDMDGAITGSSAIDGGWSLKTSNAPIRLTVPGASNAFVTALTSQGSIVALLHSLNSGYSTMAVLNLLLFATVASTMYIKSGSLWMPIAYHVSWDYFEGNVFGYPNSGHNLQSLYAIRQVVLNAITGGRFGPESGLLVTFLLLLALGWITFLYKPRKEEPVAHDVRYPHAS